MPRCKKRTVEQAGIIDLTFSDDAEPLSDPRPRKRPMPNPVIDLLSDDDTEDPRMKEKQCLSRCLDLFPDICHDHVLMVFHDVNQDIERVAGLILESGPYPKKVTKEVPAQAVHSTAKPRHNTPCIDTLTEWYESLMYSHDLD